MQTVPADQTRIALEQTACLRSQSNIGETVIHNICDGSTTTVPWGSMDWLSLAAVSTISVVLGAVLFAVGWMVVSDAFRRW